MEATKQSWRKWKKMAEREGGWGVSIRMVGEEKERLEEEDGAMRRRSI